MDKEQGGAAFIAVLSRLDEDAAFAVFEAVGESLWQKEIEVADSGEVVSAELFKKLLADQLVQLAQHKSQVWAELIESVFKSRLTITNMRSAGMSEEATHKLANLCARVFIHRMRKTIEGEEATFKMQADKLVEAMADSKALEEAMVVAVKGNKQ